LEATTLHRTPLEEEHVALGAKLGAFGGWSMPIEYSGVLSEHRAVREAAGVFDLTHLGKVEVSGTGARDRLSATVTSDVASLEVGGAQYGLLLNDRGGIVDDLITYRVAEDRWLVVPNAANVERVLGVLGSETRPDVTVTHRPDLCTLAVQGPRSLDVVGELFDVDGLEYMRCREDSYREVPTLVARSGYTGEPGVEIFVPEEVVRPLWRDLVDRRRGAGLVPCGLGARDTLRLEMGYPLHGNDISEERTPVEAGLTWAVALDKGEFPGRDAVQGRKEEGPAVRLRGLRMEGRLIPRAHYRVFDDGRDVGEVTSGTFSPTLRVGIALAYLSADVTPGRRVEVEVRSRRGPAEVLKPPFVDRSPRSPGPATPPRPGTP
jgi:aminomethyltransferase